MNCFIDFDNPNTFPTALSEWGTEFENMILSRVSLEGVCEWWQIEHQLQDLYIGEMEIVKRFVEEYADTEIAV